MRKHAIDRRRARRCDATRLAAQRITTSRKCTSKRPGCDNTTLSEIRRLDDQSTTGHRQASWRPSMIVVITTDGEDHSDG